MYIFIKEVVTTRVLLTAQTSCQEQLCSLHNAKWRTVEIGWLCLKEEGFIRFRLFMCVYISVETMKL